MENLKEIQEMNRTILNEVRRVCEKNEICYYLDSGALLGAVRHKSFIPWDDDVDISFTRKEYIKFKTAIEKEWSSGEYVLYEPKDLLDGVWYDWIPRIVHTTEKWEERNYAQNGKLDAKNMELIGMNPSIDIFIIDILTDDKAKQKKLMRKLIVYYGFAMGHRPHICYKEYKGVQKIGVWVLSHIGKHIPLEKIITYYEKEITMYQNETTNSCFFSNYGIRTLRNVYKREWFQQGKKVELDGEFYNAPNNTHEYLKMTYGNYMELPPEEERKPRHW